MKSFKILIILLFCSQAYSLEFNGKFTQGGLILGKTDPENKIFLDEKPLKISQAGNFVFGISRERSNDLKIEIKGISSSRVLIKKVSKRKFRIQRIDGLPKRKVTPNEEDMKRIRKEGKLIVKAKNINSNFDFFSKGFIRPLKGITTGVYGSQRILNGKKRRPHYGIDIASPKGTPIKSPNDGKVVLAEKDLFFTGGTLMIDHGHGLISIYSHLEKLNVKGNEKIKKGQIIGTVGSTGRSTGPHLDFRLYWNNIAVDPDLVFKN